MQIDIPTQEQAALQQQFEHFGFAYTVRPTEDLEQYSVGNVLETPWGRSVRISELSGHKTVDDYPFPDMLSDEQKADAADRDGFVIMKLDYV
ncbi:MAG: hypothetical protein ABIJ46_03440 [bacterium]